MVLEATIEAAIYIVVVFLCLSDCFRAVVKETQVDSILDWWSMSATWSMYLVLTHRLSACVYITLCYYISMHYLPYFPSKKVYVFVCECCVRIFGANRTTLWMFETNNSIHLHRRNHERCKQASLASHSERGGFCNIGSCGCLHTYNCLYYKRYSAAQNLPMMPVYIRGSVRERRSKA